MVKVKKETKEEEESHQQGEVHPHIHEVKYRDKSGNIRDYTYNYGKIGTKSHALKRIKSR